MGATRAANTDLARVGGAAGSAPRSAGGSSAPTTLPFSLEDVEALAQQGVTEVDYDASLEIERIKEACAPASEADAQVRTRPRPFLPAQPPHGGNSGPIASPSIPRPPP
jgi:hypothetical protein